jgi:porphobilinogen synthase
MVYSEQKFKAMSLYPRTRMHRNRKSFWSRELIAEVNLTNSDFIMPLFVRDGIGTIEEIETMPNVFRYTLDKLIDKVKSLYDIGIKAVMLFPYVPQELKNSLGTEALNSNNLIVRAVKEIKKAVPNIGVIADVALDPYTSHGHDGIINRNGEIDNDTTINILAEQSLILADSGVDVVAPSDMMDGRIGAIRDKLEDSGYINTQIFSYSAKFSSSLYGPFRHGIGSHSNLGKSDKKTYFLDNRNAKEAMAEVELDIAEGADGIIVKPGLVCLDIICKISEKFRSIPPFIYQVSGEYSMLTYISNYGIISERDAVVETMHAFKRAGSRAVITYYADRLPGWIKHLSSF